MDLGQNHRMGRLARLVALPLMAGLAYCLVATATVRLTGSHEAIPAIWSANAVLLAILLLRPRNEARAILLCGVTANGIAVLTSGGGAAEAFLFPVANGIELLIAMVGLRAKGLGRGALSEPVAIGRLLLWPGLLAPAASATIGGLSAWYLFGHPLLSSVGRWYVSNALGLLILTPFLFALMGGQAGRSLRGMSWRRRAELAALLLFTAMVACYVFLWARYPLLFLVIMPLMLVTFRTGWLSSQIAGHGPIAAQTDNANLQTYGIQIYLAAMLLVQMPIAAVLTAHRQLVRKLRESEQSLRLLASRSPILLLAFDLRGRCERVVGTNEVLAGRTPAELIGASFAGISEEGQYVLARAHDAALDDISQSHVAEFRIVKGHDGWIEAMFRANFDEAGRCVGTIATLHDVTARKNQALALSRSAATDSLTGLLNRAGFRARLDHALLSAAPGALSIALIDVDRFKLINDNSGHQAGDIVLQEIARRIAGEVRASDAVGRLGGDEFVILLTTPDWTTVQEICNRIVQVVGSEPIMLPSGQRLRTAISCGVARYSAGTGPDEFLNEADLALYEAKRAGRNRVVAA